MFLEPPSPTTLDEAARVQHTRLRRRITSGPWGPDLAARCRRNLGSIRADAVGEPDRSANLLLSACEGASALYDEPPKVSQADEPSRLAMAQWTAEAQLWPMMARGQVDTLAHRELFLCVEASAVDGRVTTVFRPVYADMVHPKADPHNPARPIEIREAVRRVDPRSANSGEIWTWDLWTIEGEPRRAVLDANGADVSHLFGLPPGGLRGAAYPALRADGRPILPYALYHAAATGKLLDPYYRSEIVEATLNVAVLWTFFSHIIRRASWPQRWIMGGVIAGATNENSRSQVVSDPATILEILRDPDYPEGQPAAGQWGSASDPKAVAEAIGIYERRAASYVEVDPSDLIAGDPRSGVALTVSTAGKRRSQRKYSPIFAPVDAEVLAITATMVGRALGRPGIVAEDGWQVAHTALPLSTEERRTEREEALALLGARLLSRAEARARVTGEDLETAAAKLAEIDAATPAPTPPPAVPVERTL